MTQSAKAVDALADLSNATPDISVLWLYGSQAKGTAEATSDIDLAVALNKDAEREDYFCDDLAYRWSQATGERVSVIDINCVPVPLAYAVITEGRVLMCCDALRLRGEEQRIWSLWEAYIYEHRQNRQRI